MPISKELFDQGIDDLDDRLINFLQANYNAAFSLGELAEGVGISLLDTSDELSFLQRLDDLVMDNFLERRTIHGVYYYSVA